MSQGCDKGQRCTYGRYEKGLLFSADAPRSAPVKGLTFNFGSSPLHIQWRGPQIKEISGNALLVLIFCYCSVEKLMHQRPNPIHFFFQREMARVKKMELCVGKLSFIELSALDREDSIIFAPGDQHGGLLFAEILLPIGKGIQIPFGVVED